MRDVVVGVLLTAALASVLLSCAGLVAARDAWDKLNFTGPATVIAPVAVAAAVLVEEPLSSAGVKAVLVAAASAARVREHGRFAILSEEAERRERPSRSSRR